MDILIKGIKAKIASVKPLLAEGFLSFEDKISFWLDLEGPLPGTAVMGFGVYLPPIAYTKATFLDALSKAADEVATHIIEESQKDRALHMKDKERLTRLTLLVNDIEKMLAE